MTVTDAAPAAMLFRFAYATDRGRVREQNEDAIAIDEDYRLALVADGMGGYNAGEVASGLAAEFLVTHLVDDLRELRANETGKGNGSGNGGGHPPLGILHALLRARIDGVNDAIIDAAASQPAFQGMGTTLAMLLFTSDAAITLHLGDSRIYRLRDDVLSLLTRDHSLLQEQIDAGVLSPGEARESISRNFVTRALGVDVVAEPEINEYDLMPGDLYLICSDGLPDMLSDEEIFDLLRGDLVDAHDLPASPDASGEQDEALDVDDEEPPRDLRVAEPTRLDDTAAKLVEAANARGGRDNVSVVLASVGWPRPDEQAVAVVQAPTQTSAP